MLSFLRNPIFPSDTVSTVEEEHNKDMKKMIWKIAKCQGKISEKSGNLKVRIRGNPSYCYDKQETTTLFRGPISVYFCAIKISNPPKAPRG